MKIIIATHNPGKLAEFKILLKDFELTLVSAGELGLAEPEETGATFAENAELKARAAAAASGLPALADDSGLSVDALHGAPGILSARYAAGDYPAAFTKIIAAADAQNNRAAHFTCALCFAQPSGATSIFIGQAHGIIAKTPTGTNGFGYDSIFIPDGYQQTYAELGNAIKDQISHRAKAIKQLRASLPQKP